MDQFEYVMVLVSIVIALSIAHLLTALAAGIHRFRGHGEPIRLDAVFLLWIGFVLIYLISFWWWEFSFQEIQIKWSYGLYIFVIGYSIILFMLSEILVPYRMQGITDSYVYFMEGRNWFFAALLLTLAADIIDTFLKGYEWGMRPALLVTYAVYIIVAITGIISERRSIQLGVAIVAISLQLLYQFQELSLFSF